MEDYIYYNNLYDCYAKLLTDKQRNYFENYYFDNLSLSEIANTYGISRNAVYKQLQITIKKLNEYEQKLKLYQIKQEIEILLKENDITKIKRKNITVFFL